MWTGTRILTLPAYFTNKPIIAKIGGAVNHMTQHFRVALLRINWIIDQLKCFKFFRARNRSDPSGQKSQENATFARAERHGARNGHAAFGSIFQMNRSFPPDSGTAAPAG
ncbi:hypothetical protein [Hydrogenispora ethanolica]|uniref:hypothetical protein n=1 Tax=Hydrogenispora ethanolica TaxID=1082276 RepID=UPI00105283DD|nr:hypothetical protein [Hydrogenispora ethanolica]